jgi:hypothetical protein
MICNEYLPSEVEDVKVAPSSDLCVDTPDSSPISFSTDESTANTLTYNSWSVPVLGSLNRECSLTRAFCQFFNISNASSNDIDYLLFARRYGKTYANQLARAFGWSCEEAIRAVEHMTK